MKIRLSPSGTAVGESLSSPVPRLPINAPSTANIDTAIGQPNDFSMLRTIDPPEDKIKITDSKGLKTGEYSKEHIQGLIKSSRAVGVDPNTMLSLALQESGLGSAPEKSSRSRGEVRLKIKPSLAQVNDFSEAQQKELDELSARTGIDSMYLKPAIALRDKLKYAKQLGFKDEASQLQAYNGYGVLTTKQARSGTAYGIPIGEGIDMRKNPIYGKRLLELRSDISKNKEILALINSKL